jgi:hypothetical protein
MTEYTVKLAKPHCNNCSKIKVASADGKKRYVRKDSLPIMASLAADSASDLRSRLDNITSPNQDEDI